MRSSGWEGRCEWKQEHPEKAAPLFLTQLALGDESAVISLKALIPDRVPVDGMLNYGPEFDEWQKWSDQQKRAAEEKAQVGLKAAASDPLLRRLVTMHILAAESNPSWYFNGGERAAKRCARWLAVIKDAKIGKMEDAEYIGWVAYTGANYEAAAYWLELANDDAPAANWLRAKLQRRAGKLDEAAKSMARAWQTIIQPGAYTGRKQDETKDPGDGCDEHHFSDGGFSFPGAASGDFALLRLARGEFVQAMDIFLKGGLFSDAAYVAERVLSADELKAYVDRQPDAGDRLESLRYLLGRRLVREDRYEEAARYLKPPYDKLLAKYVQALKDGADTKLPKRTRADALLTAAWLARYDGMELMGTEVAPDGFGSRGMFQDPEIAKQRQSGKYEVEAEQSGYAGATERAPVSKPMVLPPTKEEQQRLAKNKISPDIRYHYRIIAAALAEKGARFLDDNTEELADVLNTAGLWVKDRDEKLGNRLYNLIEKHCPKTQIGRAVLSRHWFVDEEGPWRPQQKAANEALHKALGVPDERE